MNAAERHEYLVDLGVRTYRETFMRLFAQEVSGGRVPGTAQLDPEDVRQFLTERTPEAWKQLAETDPVSALRDLQTLGGNLA